MNSRRAGGFTLIELLTIISIIGVLATIILTSLNVARSKGRDANRVSNLIEIGRAIALADNGGPAVGFYQDAAGTIPCPLHSLLSDCKYIGSTPINFARFIDPSKSNTPCPSQIDGSTPGLGTCAYSINTSGAGGSYPTSQNWQVCVMLENGNSQYAIGAYSYVSNSYGEISIASDTGGNVRSGCY